MARKKIREVTSKTLLKAHIKRLAGLDLPLNAVQVTQATDYADLLSANPWLKTTKLVVKPDMLFGKRGKHDLVGLNLDFAGVEQFIKARVNKQVTVDGCSGPVNTFIVEPFVPHDAEYYLCVQSKRLGDDISFSDAGGIEIEANWDSVQTVTIPTLGEASAEALAPLLGGLPLELRPKMEAFIQGVYAVFRDLDFTLLEMNPFTLDAAGAPFPLDMRGELDDTAAFKSGKKWGPIEFPLPFGRSMTSAEERILAMDENTGASLKLSILNPKGRIWTMVAGGGASVIYADTVGDLGLAHELGNYAEYSGAPNTAETYAYAKTLLDCATANPDGQSRALLVGGGIANFTDVAATFKGIIQVGVLSRIHVANYVPSVATSALKLGGMMVQAMREMADDIKAAQLKIFVRRGGPSWQAGLALMRQLGKDTGIPIDVYGPTDSMTGICQEALDFIKSSAAPIAAH